jgi:predicted nucleic acid-binding Zn ribbon protein
MKDVIQDFLKKNNKSKIYNERTILEMWNREMGDFIVQNTQSTKIENSILYVKINNAALRFELMGRKTELIRKLNDAAGMSVLQNIIFR